MGSRRKRPDPYTADLEELAEPDLVMVVYDLTADIQKAVTAQERRADAFIAGRDRDPQVPIRVLQDAAGGMTHSGVVNSISARRRKLSARKGKR